MELDAVLTREKKKILEEYDEAELKAKLQKDKSPPEKKLTEKQEVDALMKQLDEKYTEFLKDNKFTEEEKSIMFQLVEKFYMHLCYVMKRHGLYFREGEDFRLAVLRR
jgi:translation initiation factor RLI1